MGDDWYHESLQGGEYLLCGSNEDYDDKALGRAQRTYFTTALANSVQASLDTFRYRGSDSYYDDGDVLGSTNYWQLANQMHGYSGVAFWSLASITQLLSMFGHAVDINLIVWLYGGRLLMLTSLATLILEYLAYDKSYQILSDTS